MNEMSLGMTPRLAPIHAAVTAMIRDEIAPLDAEYLAEVDVGDRWAFTHARPKSLRA